MCIRDRGKWEVEVASDGPYDVVVTLASPAPTAATATIAFRGVEESVTVAAGADTATFEGLTLETGQGSFRASLMKGSEAEGVWQVEITHH